MDAIDKLSDRTIGFEFEHVSTLSHEVFRDKLARLHLPVDLNEDSRSYTGWAVKGDGSINRDEDHPVAVELTSPPLTLLKMAPQVKQALALAREFGGINSSTGLHVHIGVPELRRVSQTPGSAALMTRVQEAWNAVEKVFFSYVPPSRRHNDYCKPGISWTPGDRYHAMNVVPLNDARGTIEFRLHSGTLNHQKALAFALLCSKLCDFIVAQRGDLAALDPAASEDVPARKLKTKSREFHIHRINKKWIIEQRHQPEREYDDLRKAYDDLRVSLDLPDKVTPLRAFRYPTFGNAMTKLCAALNLNGPFRGYLEARYDRMVTKFGPISALDVRTALSQDEGNYYDEEELDEAAYTREQEQRDRGEQRGERIIPHQSPFTTTTTTTANSTTGMVWR